MLGLSYSSFLIFGGRPKRGATSQSLDLRGLPTFPFRTGGVLLLAAVDDFTILPISLSHTKFPDSMKYLQVDGRKRAEKKENGWNENRIVLNERR